MFILKLYNNRSKAAKRNAKVKAMFNHPNKSSDDNTRFCWPMGLVYDARTFEFYGFAMQEAFEGSRELDILSAYHVNESIADHYPSDTRWHRTFELDTPLGLRNRLFILYRWACAIKELHEQGGIVLGDINPHNILCTPDGKISVVDIDSMQFTVDGHTYMSGAHTAEYCPSEVMKNPAKMFELTPQYDSFSFAVSAYTILTGTHPYGNIINLPPYDGEKYNRISEMIRAGLYLRGEKKEYLRTVSGFNLHANFDKLPVTLQNIFNRTFNGVMEEYPTMEEWSYILKESHDALL